MSRHSGLKWVSFRSAATAERYERKSIAITANAPFSAWDEVFPDKAMTVAAVDRLVHHATILEMNVDSYPARSRRWATAPHTGRPAVLTGYEPTSRTTAEIGPGQKSLETNNIANADQIAPTLFISY